ncbi:unnamed protein product [Parnassius apollo]|uniref:(apollo) hypothetical protein n=1 Tax=Parnassius apollo TaxID=110799 RepID=A0A8S3XYK7_PARAO|nr:unnamed protein product [Parnassius apollo]
MPSANVPFDGDSFIVGGQEPAAPVPDKPAPRSVNVVRPLARALPVTVDSRTALNPKFSRALDFKLRRLKEKELLEANLRRPVRSRIAMGALAASDCNISHISPRERGLRDKSRNRSHPQINSISSRERTKISPRTDDSPSPKSRHKKNDSEKPRFITTVKTGQFLLPPPQLAYLLGLHTLYPPQEREKIVYSYASKPKAVSTRSKRSILEKKENKLPNGNLNANACGNRINHGEAFRGVRALIASVAGMKHVLEERDRAYVLLYFCFIIYT